MTDFCQLRFAYYTTEIVFSFMFKCKSYIFCADPTLSLFSVNIIRTTVTRTHPSFFYSCFFLILDRRGLLEPIPTVKGSTLDRPPAYGRANAQRQTDIHSRSHLTRSILDWSNHLTSMSVGGNECPQKTHTCTGSTWELRAEIRTPNLAVC